MTGKTIRRVAIAILPTLAISVGILQMWSDSVRSWVDWITGGSSIIQGILLFVILAGSGVAAWFSEKDEDPPAQCHLSVTVHEANDPTNRIPGATVTLSVPEARPKQTDDTGHTMFSFPAGLKGKEYYLNAQKEAYERRQPEPIILEDDAHYMLALTPSPSPPPTISSNENPFTFGAAVKPEQFFGRKRQIREMRNTNQSISLVGSERNGRTSMLRYIEAYPNQFFVNSTNTPIIVYLNLMDAGCATPDLIWESIRSAIQRKIGEPPWEPQADVHAVADGLDHLCANNYRLVLLIDDLERNRLLKEEPRTMHTTLEDWRAKASAGRLLLVIATRQPFDTVCQRRGITSSLGTILATIYLGAFEDNEWHDPVRERFERTHKWNENYIDRIEELSGGLPIYVQMAASMLWQYGDSQAMRENFLLNARPQFRHLWHHIEQKDQEQIRLLAQGQPPTSPARVRELQRHGIVKNDERTLFSTLFAEWVREEVQA